MKTIEENMHTWSLDEMIDQYVAAEGTPARTEFNTLVEKKVKRLESQKRAREQKASMHIVVPVHMRDAIRRNAEALGESANAYINDIFSQAVTASV